MIKRFLILAVVACLLLTAILYDQYRSVTHKVSGFIEADDIRVGSRVGGRVTAVHVQEGQRVEKDQVLVELEPFDLLARVAQAEANLAAQQADLERLQHGYRTEEIAQAKAHYEQLVAEQAKLKQGPRDQEIEVARSQLAVAKAQKVLAGQNHKRVAGLVEKRAAAAEELDRAGEQLEAATATVALREQELDLQLVGTRQEDLDCIAAQVEEARTAWELVKNGYRPENIAAAKAARDASQSALDALRVQLEELKIRSPLSGVVEAMELQPGDLVGPSAPVLSLLDDQHLWVRAYVPQNRIGIQVGQELDVVVDSIPDQTLQGTVMFVSRMAEFTPSNVQTPEERSKLVFRIKVAVTDPQRRLLPGLSADVWLPRTEAPHD
ncbi:MAG: HlyD family secretion protein [Pirellulaceae bacterium]